MQPFHQQTSLEDLTGLTLHCDFGAFKSTFEGVAIQLLQQGSAAAKDHVVRSKTWPGVPAQRLSENY